MRECLFHFHPGRGDADLAFEEGHGLAQILDGDDLQPFDHGRFGGVVFRNQQANFAFGFRPKCDWHHAFH